MKIIGLMPSREIFKEGLAGMCIVLFLPSR